jgi:hypothetical protein
MEFYTSTSAKRKLMTSINTQRLCIQKKNIDEWLDFNYLHTVRFSVV